LPTFQSLPGFLRDYQALTDDERAAFRRAVAKFVSDLRVGQFRRGLRVKGVQGSEGVFEMTWAGDGRATFQYGPEVRRGEPHVVWRRIGTHAILDRP
jgi:hypothetical protein